MQKKFLSNLGLLLLLNLLIKPIWIFGIDRNVQNLVGSAEYGFYFPLLNFTFLFYIILDFGITNFNNRNIAQHNQLLKKHFSNLFVLKVLLGILYFVIIFVFAVLWGYRGRQLHFLIWLALNQFLLSFILYLRSNISGLLLFKTESVLSVTDRVLMIFFCAVLIWGHIVPGPFKIEWFVYVQTISYLITALLAMVIVMRKASFSRFSWDWPFSLMIIKKSLPFALLVLIMYFQYRIDSVMLLRLLPGIPGQQQAGIYASAFRLLDAAVMPSYLFSILLLPIFSKQIREQLSVEQILKLSSTMIILFATATAVFCASYSHELMALLYKEHVNESANLFPVLMYCLVPISLTYIFGTLVTARGKLMALSLVAAISMVMNVLLNLILIPTYQAYGSAVSSLISQSFFALGQIALAQYYFRFKLNKKYLLRIALFLAGLFAISIAIKYTSVRWSLGFIGGLFLVVVWAASLNLLDIRGLFSILRKPE
ncbi:MAG: oligosaccharide flippase family protein [Bacteroidota bacterium]